MKQANRILESHEQRGIQMITPVNPFYKQGMPIVTYYKGILRQGRQIAIVGTRTPSVEGRILAQRISSQYIQNDYIVNSGLALGIDIITHQKALQLEGITQAFVAHGLDRCYPKKHQYILDQIVDRGCVFSQYEVGIDAKGYRFLERNALMVQMSDEVFVIEAGEKSGALHTGLTALNQEKSTFSIRGPEDSEKCAGNRKLILAGAIAIDYEDQSFERPVNILCDLLRSKAMTFDSLQQQTKFSSSDLYFQLFELENHKWVSLRADGHWYYNGW